MTPGSSSRTLDADGLVKAAPDTIFTYTGRTIRPLDPNPDDICIEDIAHALSNQCRWTGHLESFSSVAEHSVRVAWLVPDELKLEALLHDASEAYLSDIARPVKKAPGFAETYLKFEAQLEAAVAVAFGLPQRDEMHAEIKAADQYTLEAEAALLGHENLKQAMGVSLHDDWTPGSLPARWSPRTAEANFLLDFSSYWGIREAQMGGRL